MDISKLRSTRRTVTVQYGDESVTVTYSPSAITPKWEQEFVEAARDEWKSRAVIETLSRVVVDWDVTDGGEPYPPTVENLSALPLDFLGAVLQAIIADQLPKEKSGGSFGGGS